jgi:hypothetical protein
MRSGNEQFSQGENAGTPAALLLGDSAETGVIAGAQPLV